MMGSKNAFFKKLKQEQDRKSKAVGDLTERWTMQAEDALSVYNTGAPGQTRYSREVMGRLEHGQG